jgi:hypothetical protein
MAAAINHIQAKAIATLGKLLNAMFAFGSAKHWLNRNCEG